MDTTFTNFDLGKIYGFNIGLPFSDQVTDVVGFFDLMIRGHVHWAMVTLMWVFLPFIVELLIVLTKWINAAWHKKPFSSLEHLKKSFLQFPFVAPLWMLQRWYQLWWNRQSDYQYKYGKRYGKEWIKKRNEKIEEIIQDEESHGVREAFLESFGQMVTQMVIITCTGHMSSVQMGSLPVSFMALAFGASKAFFWPRIAYPL